MKLLIFATVLEAEPFIKNLSLELEIKKPFSIYSGENHKLLITGIGKANAAMATCHILTNNDFHEIINMGAAGALKEDISKGEIFSVKRIFEPDRPHLQSNEPRFTYPKNTDIFKTKNLATRDRPAIERSDREEIGKYADIIDMEAAAILQCCRKFKQNCTFIKFISDSLKDNENNCIVENIEKFRDLFYREILSKKIL